MYKKLKVHILRICSNIQTQNGNKLRDMSEEDTCMLFYSILKNKIPNKHDTISLLRFLFIHVNLYCPTVELSQVWTFQLINF